MHRTQSDYRVGVVGAGLGGLLAAAEISGLVSGADVTVFESAPAVGGRARTSEMGGAAVNLGPHALYRDGELAKALARQGVVPTGGQVSGAWATTEGEYFRLPVGVGSLLRTGLFSWGERLCFAKLMMGFGRFEAKAFAGQSAADVIAQAVADVGGNPRVAETLGALGRLSTYAGDLTKISADVLVSQLQVSMGGVLYLDGGWQQMVDALLTRALALGVTLQRGTRVLALDRKERQVMVQTGEGWQAFDAVVMALDAQAARKLLPGEWQGAAGLEGALRPLHAACLDVVTERWPRAGADLCLGVDQPTYISNHSRYANLADEGCHVVHALHYSAGDRPAEQVRAELERALEGFQPGWREGLVEARFLPRMRVVSHLPSAQRGGLAGRPAVAPPGLEGVCLVGDWVGPRGWLADASAASAVEAARAIEAWRVHGKSRAA